MATSVIENALGNTDLPSLSQTLAQHGSDVSDNPAFNGSYVFGSSHNIPMTGNSGCGYIYPTYADSTNKSCTNYPTYGDSTNKNGITYPSCRDSTKINGVNYPACGDSTKKSCENTKSYLEGQSLNLKTSSASYDFEKILGDSTFQKLTQEPATRSSLEELLGSNFDSYKSDTLTLDKSSDRKRDFKTEASCDQNILKSGSELSKQRHEKSLNVERNGYCGKSQSFDFDQLMQTYNFDASKETKHVPQAEMEVSKKITTRTSYDFEASDAAMRLRSSVQSKFLSNELWRETSPKRDDVTCQGSNAVRTIEEILKQHGISDNAPKKTTKDEANNRATNSLNFGTANLSQNNETASSLTKMPGSETGQISSSTQDNDAHNSYTNYGGSETHFSLRMNQEANISHQESRNLTTQGISNFTVNSSQNNETSKSQPTTETDPVKKYGSSVDFSNTGRFRSSMGTNFRMLDYGMSMPLSGDNARSSLHASTMDSKQFEGSISRSKFDAPQVDAKSTFNASKASHIDIIKNMGSATDALEYSMSSERQRLRKLDTMISATPFNYSSLELPRSLRSQYMSPERTYSSLMPSDLPSRRIYSTSTMPSTSSHAARYSAGNSMAGNAAQRDSNTALNKSTSAPGSAATQLARTHGSSVDSRAMYWPRGSRMDYNKGYNNAYNPQLLEKFVQQKNGSLQKKMPANKKKECPLKSKKEEDVKRNDSHMIYHQTPTGINFLNNARVNKPSTTEKKKIPIKTEGRKKTPDKDLNHSKNVGGLYDGFDFVKDLNRMWQETVFGAPAKSSQSQKSQKYMPYKPANQEKKDGKSATGQSSRDTFGKDSWKSSIQSSDSNWTLSSSTGAHGHFQPYGPDYGLQSVHKVRSHSSMGTSTSVGAPSGGQSKAKGSNSSLVKSKPNTASATTTKQPQTTPKSILKHPANKSNGYSSLSTNRPQSALAGGSKSCTQNAAYQLPYHLVRGFSPVEPQKPPSRVATPGFGKKQEPPTNKKQVARTSTATKQGRRI